MYWYNIETRHQLVVPPRVGGTLGRNIFDAHPDWRSGQHWDCLRDGKLTQWYRDPFSRWRSWFCQFVLADNFVIPIWRVVMEQSNKNLIELKKQDRNAFTLEFLPIFKKYFYLDTHTIPQTQWLVFNKSYNKSKEFELVHLDNVNDWLALHGLQAPKDKVNPSDKTRWNELSDSTKQYCEQFINGIYQSDTELFREAVSGNF
jgi:hypothetical protein